VTVLVAKEDRHQKSLQNFRTQWLKLGKISGATWIHVIRSFFMLIYSHPHEDSLSFTHSFLRDLCISSQCHGGAHPLIPLCACLHLCDDNVVSFHELCILLLHELCGDDDDFHLRILSSTSCMVTAMTFTSASSSSMSCVVTTSTTTTSVSASSTTARQGPERATTSDPWQRWRHGSSSSTMAARVLLYGGSKQGLDLGPTGLDLGSAFLFLKINFLNQST
jgi:hypothetical protein